MESIIKILAEAASGFDNANRSDLADETDKIAAKLLDIKTAQYLGIQGYWIRNSRCFANCWRQKRTSAPTKAAQEVWNECHDEYVKSINNDGSAWDKYADSQKTELIKHAETYEFPAFQENFDKLIESGRDIGSAIFRSINQVAGRLEGETLDQSTQIAKLAAKALTVNPNIAVLLSQASSDLLKESQFLSNMYNRFRGKGRDFSGHSPFSLSAKTLKTMIDDLSKTLDNYSHQRKLILSHLDTIQSWNGPTASDAKRVAQLLRGGPLTRSVVQQINTIMADMIGKENGAQTVVEPSDPSTSPASATPGSTPAAQTGDLNLVPEPTASPSAPTSRFDASQNISRQTILENKPIALQVVKEWQQQNPDKWQEVLNMLKQGQSKKRDLSKTASVFNLKKRAGIKDDVGGDVASMMRTMIQTNPQDFIDALYSIYPNLSSMMMDIDKAQSLGAYNVAPGSPASPAPRSAPIVPPPPPPPPDPSVASPTIPGPRENPTPVAEPKPITPPDSSYFSLLDQTEPEPTTLTGTPGDLKNQGFDIGGLPVSTTGSPTPEAAPPPGSAQPVEPPAAPVAAPKPPRAPKPSKNPPIPPKGPGNKPVMKGKPSLARPPQDKPVQ